VLVFHDLWEFVVQRSGGSMFWGNTLETYPSEKLMILQLYDSLKLKDFDKVNTRVLASIYLQC